MNNFLEVKGIHPESFFAYAPGKDENSNFNNDIFLARLLKSVKFFVTTCVWVVRFQQQGEFWFLFTYFFLKKKKENFQNDFQEHAVCCYFIVILYIIK